MSTLLRPLSGHAGARPDAPALAISDTTLSWGETIDRIETLASGIAARTLVNDTVAIDLRSSIDAALAFVATARAGRTAMLTESTWPGAIRAAVACALPADLILNADTIGAVATVPGPVPDMPGDDAPLLIGFTSGSTGMVKGYTRTHGSWTRSVAAAQAAFPMTADDRVCAPGTLSFSLFAYALMHGLHIGATTRLVDAFRPRTLVDTMRADGTTVLFCVPTQAAMLIEAAERTGRSIDSVRLILSSGQKWPDDATARAEAVFPNAEIAEFYGASELSFVSYVRGTDPVPAGSVGRAFDGVDIAIRDADGDACPPGVVGAVWVRSRLAFDRYVMGDAPECRRDGDWITVGDHGYLDDDGYLFLAGREKRMLVTSGANLYPEILEAALCRHPGVAAAAVIGLPDPVRGQRIVAAVSLRDPSHPPVRDDLIALCADNGGAHAAPRAVHVIGDWPRTPGGKTDLPRIAQMLDDATPPPLL